MSHSSLPLSPKEHFQQDLLRDDFAYDAAQENVVNKLEILYQQIQSATKTTGLLGRLFKSATQTSHKGLYLWGGVGRGKTYLMDIFFESLPFEQKLRLHFHRFMRRVHAGLVKHKGTTDPLNKVADEFSKQARVLCFDEFFVTDITDAMILATMLQGLIDRGVTIVTTSNIEPSGLYKDGLQRDRFLPAIDLLYAHTEIVNVDSGIDYRLRALQQVALYHFPWDKQAEAAMEKSFMQLVPDVNEIKRDHAIEIEGRYIQSVAYAEDIAWFDFFAICDGPRSQNDYIELACEFHAVLISNIPNLSKQDDLARRFVNLVDEFYDHNVTLILSAQVALDKLYESGRLEFEFKRTLSRLQEMQSLEYLGAAHKA